MSKTTKRQRAERDRLRKRSEKLAAIEGACESYLFAESTDSKGLVRTIMRIVYGESLYDNARATGDWM